MISNELIEKHKVITAWSCSKKDETIPVGLIKSYLGKCADGSWLVVIADSSRAESEVLLLNTRSTALKQIRDRGFYTRICKIYSSKQGASV